MKNRYRSYSERFNQTILLSEEKRTQAGEESCLTIFHDFGGQSSTQKSRKEILLHLSFELILQRKDDNQMILNFTCS